jgi:ribosomal protein S18 acetylase RimI-like enzyme
VALTRLESAAEVLVATGHDAFARSSLRRPIVQGWVGNDAVAWLGLDPEERTPYLSSHGEPAAVAALVTELLTELPPRQRVTLPRGTPRHLPAWVGMATMTDWDFRWLAAPPPVQPGEQHVAPASDAAVRALLEAASPKASAQPGDVRVRRWVGIARPDGRLLACAGDTSGATGVGHISSIAVDPASRGRGLGRAVTAALARSQFAAGCDLVTLGMYADNAAGRALYDGLGFHDEHRFTSGPLQVRGRW